MKLTRLNKADGSWDKLEQAWREECVAAGEDYDGYAKASLGTLRGECDEGAIDEDTGVFALEDDAGRIHAACFLNCTLLPGYSGKVLRVRHFVLSPYYDFAPLQIEDYASIMGEYFVALVQCSEGELRSQHIKIHYRSPYDRIFFGAVSGSMEATGRFAAVDSKGMWLHLTKS